MKTSISSRLVLSIIAISMLLAGAAQAASLGTWPAVNIGKPAKLFVSSVAFGNNVWVAVGQGGFIATSPDGKTWTRRSAGITRDFNHVNFANGRFIAVCKAPDTGTGAKIWVSDNNGVSWQFRNSDASGDGITVGLHCVASDNNGTVIAVGGSFGGKITRSTDNGQTWHIIVPPASVSIALYGVGYGNGVWVACGASQILKSTDAGSTWTIVNTSIGLGRDVAFGNSRFVICDNTGGKLWWSSDGATWKAASAAADATGGNFINAHGCTFADGLFVAVTEYGHLWTSENGRVFRFWKAAGGDPDAWGVGGTSRLFVVVGGDFTLKYGTAWNSPPWLKARLGGTWDHPFTAFDAEDAPLKKIALPEYRVNTASLNLGLESTLFFMPALGTNVALKLVYCSSPTLDSSTDIGMFGKNWHGPFETMVGQFGPDARVITQGGRSLLFSTPAGEDLSTVADGANLKLKNPDGVFDQLIFDGPTHGFKFTMKGTRMTYFYEKAGGPGNAIWYLTKIGDRNGNVMTFNITTSTAGRVLNSITDGASRTITLTNNTDNLCTRLTSPDGRQVNFIYDTHKNLTSITDMMGYQAHYEYDAKGFLMSMNTQGRVNHFEWLPRPGYEDETSLQDNAGDKVLSQVITSNGGIIKYEVLANDGGIKRTDGKGLVTTFKSEKGETTAIADPLGKLRSITYGTQKLPTAVKDELGNSESSEYDANGNQTKATDALGNVNSFTYDADGNQVTRTDPLNQVWTFGYDANANLTGVTTPLNHTTTYTYYPNGLLKNAIDPGGGQTLNTYNANGDLTSAADPVGHAALQEYDGMGRCTKLTDRRGNVKLVSYDNNNRITLMRYGNLGSDPTRTFVHDAFGQTSFTDEMGATTTIQRNDFGFITKLTDPLGNSVLTDYDADNHPVKTTDALGRVNSTTYDNKGRPTVLTDPLGKTIIREYNSTGRLLSLTDKRKAKTSFAYDANQRLTSITNALNQKISHLHDALGRTTVTTNARSDQIRITYDAEGRATKKEYMPKGTATFTTEATSVFDQSANLTSRTDDWGTTNWTYDTSNRITSTTFPTGKTLGTTYDESSQVATLTYPGGLVVSYTYDNVNRHQVPTIFRSGSEVIGMVEPTANVTQVTISLGGQTRTINFTHDAAGRLLSIQRPAGNVNSIFVYDTAGRTASIDHSITGNTYFHWALAYDAVGNLLTEGSTGTVTQGALMPVAATMTYDLANRLKTRGTTIYTHDADGNLTLASGSLFNATYTPENHPIQIDRKPTGTLETIGNTFDGSGMRVKREIGAETINYHYGANNRLLFTTDDSDNILQYFIWGDRVLLAMIEGSSIPSGLRYYLTGRLANIVATVDDTGALVASYAYDPTGNCQRFEHQVGVPDKNPFTFVGGLGVVDDGHGLYYMSQRFYDATLGRFIQADPTGFEGGLNLYAYASGNPANLVDPAGTFDINWGLVGKGLLKLGAAAVGVGIVAVTAPIAGPIATAVAAVAAIDAGLNATSGGLNLVAAISQDPKAAEKLKPLEDWDSAEKIAGRATGIVYTGVKSVVTGEKIDPKDLESNMNTGGQLGTVAGLALNLVGSIDAKYKALNLLSEVFTGIEAGTSIKESASTLATELSDSSGSSSPASNTSSDTGGWGGAGPTYYGRGMER